jgi:MtN3 and saliva related transmembrane protein
MFWTLIGATAATLTMFALIPQIVKSFRTKSVKDISEITLFQMLFGAILWAAYGVHLRDMVIITANLVTLITLSILLIMYFKYGKSK